MTNTIDILALLGPDADPAAAGLTLRQVGAAAPSEATELLAIVDAGRDRLPSSDPAILGGLLRGLHTLFLNGSRSAIAALIPDTILTIDDALPDHCPNRHLLLHLLVLAGNDDALRAAVERLNCRPPANWEAAGLVLSPLMQSTDWPIEAVFPDLLTSIEHPSMASTTLDLANFLVHENRLQVHPAAARVNELNRLLAAVTGRLERFEREPRSLGDDIATVQERLSEAISLAVSLCDALGLIGATESLPRLTETMHLKHRRVRSEAAGALARMGDEHGIEQLIALVEEPSARLRVIAYADELGLSDRIDQRFRSQESTAEASLALWLSQPAQMGIPPTSVETLDQRFLYWPGYDRPLDCFLVRFHYDMGDRTYSNVGISGPVTFALANNVADLPVDDIYAIYAGWQAEHADIFAIAAEHLHPAQRRLAADLATHADRSGYHDPQVELFGVFFEEQAAVFRATRDDKPCWVVTDGLEAIHLAIQGRPRELAAADLWNLYKGRKILRTFNPSA